MNKTPFQVQGVQGKVQGKKHTPTPTTPRRYWLAGIGAGCAGLCACAYARVTTILLYLYRTCITRARVCTPAHPTPLHALHLARGYGCRGRCRGTFTPAPD